MDSARWLGGILGFALAAPTIPAADVPSTDRSRDAVARVRPALERDVEAAGSRFGAPIFIRIFKDEKELELWVEHDGEFRRFRTYDISTYSGRLGPKLREGDRQAPEGFYFVNAGRMNPASRFHLSFDLGYPNAFDRHHGRTGNALMVHGSCVSVGCYAMTDRRIEEIWALADAALRGGQPFFRVHVFPFRMTADAMRDRASSRWAGFWRNLKQGYDAFERTRRPPNVVVRDGRYAFEIDE